MAEELIDGVELKIARQVLTVPPLNFKQLRKLAPQLKTLAAIDSNSAEISDEEFAAMIDVVHTALRRNYPNMSRDDIEENLDLANAPKVLKAVMAASGLTRSGEVRPGTSP